MTQSKTYPHIYWIWHQICARQAIMRIDVQFSGEKGQLKQGMRDFHAPCVGSEPREKQGLGMVMALGASIVMITFVGLLLKALA
mgnify:FL=1